MKNKNVAAGAGDPVTPDQALDAEVERIAALSIEEVRADLCRMNLTPTQALPERLRELIIRARREAQNAENNSLERQPSVTPEGGQALGVSTQLPGSAVGEVGGLIINITSSEASPLKLPLELFHQIIV